jgi:hypothetical protein
MDLVWRDGGGGGSIWWRYKLWWFDGCWTELGGCNSRLTLERMMIVEGWYVIGDDDEKLIY